MAHGKETPRQKMIGMMYLVLTAMLALNVSKDVIKAFTLVDNGLMTTIENFAAKNEGLYNEFMEKYIQNEAKVGDWKDKADEVRARSQELYDFIHLCKVEIVEQREPQAIEEGRVNLFEVVKLDDTDNPGEIMIVKHRGEELYQKLHEHSEFLLSLIDDKETYANTVEAIEGNLSTEIPEGFLHEKRGVTPTWESTYFENMPLVAVVTVLSKMQADVRNTEAEMINYLLGQIGAGDININVVDAVVIPNSSYVFTGQEYRAQVFLAGYDSTQMPEVVLRDGTMLEVESGRGIFTATSTSTGPKTWGGTIRIESEGNVISRDFEASYEVGVATATVAASGMNVFFRGIPNPVSISAGGVPESSVRPSPTSGTIRKVRAGEYTFTPGPQGNQVTINVYSETESGRTLMARGNFRVENLPTPNAKIQGVQGPSGRLTAGQLSRLQIVEAEAENFFFEVDYEVQSFDVSFQGQGGMWGSLSSSSNNITSQQRELFRTIRVGSKLFFENIKATGPDGVLRTLNNIIITVV